MAVWRRVVFAALVAGPAAGLRGHALADESRPAIPPEALAAWSDYEERSDITRVTFVGDDADSPTQSIFKVRGTNRVIIWERFDDGKWSGEAWGRNDRYWFSLQRDRRDAPRVVAFLDEEDPGVDAGLPKRMFQINDASFRAFPLSVGVMMLPDLVRHPSFRVTEVRQSDGLFEFRFSADPDGEILPQRVKILFDSGRIVLDPSKSWLPVEYELRSSAVQSKTLGRYTDFRYVDRAWVPLGASGEVHPAEGKVNRDGPVTHQVTVREPVPQEEFTLTGFGLPEPAADATPGTAWIWLVVAGVLLLAASLCLRYRRKSGAAASA